MVVVVVVVVVAPAVAALTKDSFTCNQQVRDEMKALLVCADIKLK